MSTIWKKFGLCCIPFILGTVNGGESGFVVDNHTPIASVRAKNLRFLARFKSKFAWQDYINIIDELAKKDRYQVVTARDYAAGNYRKDRIVVMLRHDFDNAPFHGLQMAKEEAKRGISSSYYILHGATAYYGTKKKGVVTRYAALDPLYKEIYDLGHEVGVHSDLLTLMILFDIDPVKFQAAELAHWKKLGINVTGTVCHGSVINSMGLNNTWLFAEHKRSGEYTYKGKTYKYGHMSHKDFGFDYEGYLLKYTHRLSDIGKYDGKELLRRLQEDCKTGDTVSILMHPIHWREGSDIK